MKLFLVLIISAIVSFTFAAPGSTDKTEVTSLIEEQSIEKQFLIIKSTRDYKDALMTAQQASTTLGIKLDLRDLTENKESGLTLSKEICEKEEGGVAPGWPCYLARGRWDDGTFISIEYSSAYEGFRKGYYIVVVATYPKDDESGELAAVLKKAKIHFPDAYVKTEKVYMGCMH